MRAPFSWCARQGASAHDMAVTIDKLLSGRQEQASFHVRAAWRASECPQGDGRDHRYLDAPTTQEQANTYRAESPRRSRVMAKSNRNRKRAIEGLAAALPEYSCSSVDVARKRFDRMDAGLDRLERTLRLVWHPVGDDRTMGLPNDDQERTDITVALRRMASPSSGVIHVSPGERVRETSLAVSRRPGTGDAWRLCSACTTKIVVHAMN